MNQRQKVTRKSPIQLLQCKCFLDFVCPRLFRNLMKEVRLYAQKFIDRGKVGGSVSDIIMIFSCNDRLTTLS